MNAWNIQMYSPSITEASKSVLIEISRCLGDYRNYLVLAGGWAPYFILKRFGQRGAVHCGSIDVDLVLNPELITRRVYETIVEAIGKRGYEPARDESGKEIPFRFERRVKSPLDGAERTIPVDFMTEPEKARKLHAQVLRVQRDLRAVIIPGCGVVFSHNFRHAVRGVLPANGETEVSINIADVAGSLTTKGLALEGRYKEKDPYDIYSMVKFFKKGPTGAAYQMRKYLVNPVVKKAMRSIEKKFRTQGSEGPSQAARFMAPTDANERERAQADVHVTLRKFFAELAKT